MIEKKLIIEYLKKSIQSLLKYKENKGLDEINDCTYTFNLCSAIEAAFLHEQLKYTSKIFKKLNRSKQSYDYEYWSVIKEIIPKSLLTNLRSSDDPLTNVGYSRLWIRHAINESTLICYLDTLRFDTKLLNRFYSKESLMRDDELYEAFSGLLRSIEEFKFNLDLNSPLLNTWVNSDALKLAGLDMTPTNLIDFYSDMPSEHSVSSEYINTERDSIVQEGSADCGSIDSNDEVLSFSLPVISRNLMNASGFNDTGATQINSTKEGTKNSDVVITSDIIRRRNNLNTIHDEEIGDERVDDDDDEKDEPQQESIEFKNDNNNDESIEFQNDEESMEFESDDVNGAFNSEEVLEESLTEKLQKTIISDDCDPTSLSNQNEENVNALEIGDQLSDINEINTDLTKDAEVVQVSMACEKTSTENNEEKKEEIDNISIHNEEILDDSKRQTSRQDSYSKNWDGYESITVDIVPDENLNSLYSANWTSPMGSENDQSYFNPPQNQPLAFQESLEPRIEELSEKNEHEQPSTSSAPSAVTKVSLFYNRLYASTSDFVHKVIQRTSFYDQPLHHPRNFFPFNRFIKETDDTWEFLGDSLLSKTTEMNRLIDVYPGKETTSTMDGENSVFGGNCYRCKEKLQIKQCFIDYYDGNLYCQDCESSTKAIIPRDVIYNWDFVPKLVSETTKRYLSESMVHPNIDLSHNAILFDIVPELSRMQNLRHKLCILWLQITSCDYDVAAMMRQNLYPRDYMLGLVSEKDLYSLEDLIMVRSGVLERNLTHIIEKIAVPHIMSCSDCKLKALPCDKCRDKNKLIYTHDIDSYSQCTSRMCHSVVHNQCKSKTVESFYCKRCHQFLVKQEPIVTASFDSFN